jgi:hypothetical protein
MPWEKLFGKAEYALGSRSDIVHRAEDETDEEDGFGPKEEIRGG